MDAVSATAGDDMLSVMVPGSAQTFQTRSVYGSDPDSGEALLYEARFFSGAMAGVAVGIRCPEGADVRDSRKVPLLGDIALMIAGN